MDKGIIIDATMWAQLENMFFYGTKEDIYLAVGIIAECELESFNPIGCWYMKQIYDYVLGKEFDGDVHMFIVRTTQWLKETENWQKMRKEEEVVWPPRM